MTDMSRERKRGVSPIQETGYDRRQKARIERIARYRAGRVVIHAKDVDQLVSQQSRGRHYTDIVTTYYGETDLTKLPAATDFMVFSVEIRAEKTGKHRHQGGFVIYVIQGEGYTVHDGHRLDWKGGDLIELPTKPGGIEHQHFNTGDIPVKWVAFRYEPFMIALGDEVEQLERSPEYKG